MLQLRRLWTGIALAFAASLASAQTIDQTDRGWYDSFGIHDPINENFIAGTTGGAVDYRNWFVFDLSGITDVITGATLVLEMPLSGYSSLDPTETYNLYSVSTDPQILIDGIGGLSAFDDLGMGDDYGSRVMSAKDNLTLVEIPLTQAALDDMNAAEDLFALGGAVTTLAGSQGFEFCFGFSSSIEITKLVLETAPAECFLVIGNGPAQSTFATNMHSWTTQVGKVEDFYLVSLVDFPEFHLPVDRIGGPKTRRLPDQEPEPKRTIRWTLSEPAPDPTSSAPATVGRTWMQDRTFTVQVVMWNPGEFPDDPEQYSHPLLIRVRPDGRVVSIPYGSGTGMEVWAETGIDEDGNTVVRFPFTIPGL